MTAPKSLDDRLAELVTVREELRHLITEAHAATKDLRAAVRASKEELELDVEARLNAAVSDGLAEYATVLRKAMDDGIAHVAGEFDKLAAVYLGTDRSRLELLGLAGEARIRDQIAARKADR